VSLHSASHRIGGCDSARLGDLGARWRWFISPPVSQARGVMAVRWAGGGRCCFLASRVGWSLVFKERGRGEGGGDGVAWRLLRCVIVTYEAEAETGVEAEHKQKQSRSKSEAKQ